MSASVTTPIKATALSNESPLPTPPQAMHDLIRNNRGAGRMSHTMGADGGGDRQDTLYASRARRSLPDEVDEDLPQGRQGSSSPSVRSKRSARTLAASTTAAAETHGGRASPGPLATSMGSQPIPRGHGLGTQMGIQTAAPWSVGRSIKRIGRHTGPDKPPQRVVAPPEEEEDAEDERAAAAPSPIAEEENRRTHEAVHIARSASGNGHASGSGDGGGGSTARRSAENGRAGSGSDGSGGREAKLLQVPLGADEDEEEEDVFHDITNRLANAARTNHEAVFKRGVRYTGAPVASEPQAQRRRAAISDIMSAKVPSDTAPPRRVLTSHAATVDPVHAAAAIDAGASLARGPAAVQPTPRTVSDFMMLVRQEATRQKGSPFWELLSSKPSKDLETKFNGYKFKKIRKAGEGGFSTVWVVRGPYAAPDPLTAGAYIDVPENDQAYFAMKQVTLKKMEQISREEVLEECNLLQTLASKANNEDFILRFFGWKSSTGSLKILLELGEHDFNQILRAQRLSRDQIVTYWHQMLQAVHFTHEEGNIVHTDLKPANFLMANGRLKLIDFGIAQKIPVGTIHIKRDAMIGTPNYMAPETVRAVKEGRSGRPREATQAATRVYKAGKASDVWAMGCILYQMVYNRPPFEAFHGDEKLRAILDPKHTIEYPPVRYGPPRADADGHAGEEADDDLDDGDLEAVDFNLLDVMRLTLTYSASERVTIPDLLQHPLLRPLELQRKRTLQQQAGGWDASPTNGHADDDDDEDQAVPMSRGTLRDILRKMYIYARNGELHEDNLEARADALFDNMLSRHQQLHEAR